MTRFPTKLFSFDEAILTVALTAGLVVNLTSLAPAGPQARKSRLPSNGEGISNLNVGKANDTASCDLWENAKITP